MLSPGALVLGILFLYLICSNFITPAFREGMEACQASPETNSASVSVLSDEVKELDTTVGALEKAVSSNSSQIKSLSEQVKNFQKAALYKAKYSSK